MLFCRAYFSSAISPFSPDSLMALVDASRRKNLEISITSVLCYYDGSFLQILEGERATVDTLLDVIKADPRHNGVLEVYGQPILERAFPDWAMALVKLEQLSTGREDLQGRPTQTRLGMSGSPDYRISLWAMLDVFRLWVRT